MVLLHHAVIPYTYFGHTDPKYFFGFDMVVLATDSFFMAMFFFLSGLFAWSGIARKGALSYLKDRLLRLGLPFVICAFTVIPLAYYAISLRHHPEIGFSEYWWNMVTKGPWPSGPIWFLWVLFAFDLVACLLHRLSPNLLDPINRLSLHGRRRPVHREGRERVPGTDEGAHRMRGVFESEGDIRSVDLLSALVALWREKAGGGVASTGQARASGLRKLMTAEAP